MCLVCKEIEKQKRLHVNWCAEAVLENVVFKGMPLTKILPQANFLKDHLN